MPTKVQKLCLYCKIPHTRKKFCSVVCCQKYHNLHHPRGFYAKQPDREVVQREITIGGNNLSEMISRKMAQVNFFEEVSEYGNDD